MFIKRLVINNASQALQFGSRWILNISLISILTKEQFANFSFAYSIANILMSIIPFGSATYLINSAAESVHYEVEKSLTLSFLINIFIITIYGLLFLILYPYSENNDLTYIAWGILISIPFSLNIIFFSFLKSLHNFSKELITNGLFFLSTICFIYYISNYKISIIEPFIFLILINSIFSIYLLLHSKINIKNIFFYLKNIQSIFNDRKYYGGQEILNTIINQMSLIILFYLLPKEEYAIFRTFLVLISPFMLFTTSIGQIVLLNFKKNLLNLSLLSKSFFNAQLINISIGGVSAILMFSLTYYTFAYFKIHEYYSITYYILLSTIILRLCISVNEMFLVTVNQQKSRFTITLTVAILNIVGLLLFSNAYGIFAAVIINLLSNIILLIITSYFVFKHFKLSN